MKYKLLAILFVLLFSIVCFQLLIVENAEADGFTLANGGHFSIAPSSIPQGIIKVGMTELDFRNGSSGDPNTSISQITIQLTGTVSLTDISNVYVYFDGGNGTYDAGNSDDNDAINGGGPVQFGGSSILPINIDTSVVNFGWGAWSHLFVAFDVASNADPSATVGCEIIQVVYGPSGNGTGGPGSPLTISPHGSTENIDSYEVTLNAAGPNDLSPTAKQGDNDVFALQLIFTPQESTNSNVYISSIKLHRIGAGSDSDIATGGITLYDTMIQGQQPAHWTLETRLLLLGASHQAM